MSAISQPLIAHDAADSIWRCAKAIHEGNNIPVQLDNLRHAQQNLQSVAEWARKAGTFSYRNNTRVRTQLINASGGLSLCISQLVVLTVRVAKDPSDVDAIMKLMLLRTVIKQIQFAPALDIGGERKAEEDQESLELLRELGDVEPEESAEPTSSIFGKHDPLTDEE